MMKKVLVASHNPVKLQAARKGFERMFPGETFQVTSISAPSSAPAQPLSDQETLKGALERSEKASHLAVADYWVGIEGGVDEQEGEMCAFAWVVVRTKERVGKSRSGIFSLPPAVANLVRSGLELGEADDRVFGRANSSQENGAIGLLTGDVIDRSTLIEQAVILALVPFKNPLLWT